MMPVRSLLFLVATSAGVATASSAHAATCAFDADTQVAAVGAAGGAVVSVSRGRIMVSGVACGTARVTNTRRIAVRGGGSGEKVTIKLAGGAFAPGADLEPTGASEIELDVDLGGGTDTLVIAGGAAADRLVIGTAGVDLDDDDDADVSLTGVEKVTMSGGAGDDMLSGAGDGSTGGAWARPLTLQGAVGNDTLTGGTSNDKMMGGDGDDYLAGGAGDDDLDGNAGSDLMQGEEGDDDLDGGDGDDVEEGGEGNDDFACGLGTDTTDHDAEDDQGEDDDGQGEDDDGQGDDCELQDEQ